MTKLNSDFDDLTVIENLTVNNIAEIPYEQMLAILTPLVLVQVPESNETVEEKKRLDYLLARTANLYAYLQVLWGYSSYQRAGLKRTDAQAAEDMQKKKETLYALAQATKLKYEACSRKITVLLEGEGDSAVTDQVGWGSRREARDNRSAQSSSPPKATTTPSKARGGWGNI